MKEVTINCKNLTPLPSYKNSDLWLIELVKELEAEEAFKLGLSHIHFSVSAKTYSKMIKVGNFFYDIQINKSENYA